MKTTIKGQQVTISDIRLDREGTPSKSGKTMVLFFGTAKLAVDGKVVTINVTAYTPKVASQEKGA